MKPLPVGKSFKYTGAGLFTSNLPYLELLRELNLEVCVPLKCGEFSYGSLDGEARALPVLVGDLSELMSLVFE